MEFLAAMISTLAEATVSGAWAWGLFGGAVGAGLAVFGGAYGIAKLSAAASEATARQPEAGPGIRVNMIITAAMIEGVALFGVAAGFMAQSAVGGIVEQILGH